MKYISNPPENHFNGLSRDDVGLYEDDKVAEGIEVIAFGKMNTQNEIKKLRENGGFDVIKFSLAEEENGRLSNFLEGLPFSEQWVVARDIDKAILKGKTAEGNNTVFKVPSMSKSTDKAGTRTSLSTSHLQGQAQSPRKNSQRDHLVMSYNSIELPKVLSMHSRNKDFLPS